MPECDAFKNILAIRFMRLGDVALLLPALARLKRSHPGSRLTLLTDSRCAPLAELCPFVDEVIGVNRLQMRDGSRLAAIKSMVQLAADIRRRDFDLVVDFLSFRETNLLAWLSGAPNRLAMRRRDGAYLRFCFNMAAVPEDKKLHVADMFQRIVTSVANGHSVSSAVDPLVQLPAEALNWAALSGPQPPVFAMYVGAPVSVRRWPAGSFAQVAEFAAKEFGARVAILAGAAEAAVAREVRDLCQNPEEVFLFTDLTIPQLAAIISRSRLLLSNDTGPMHLGPVLGVPTLGLFSVGYPEHYRPLGERSRCLRANPIEAISIEDVIKNVREMWSVTPES